MIVKRFKSNFIANALNLFRKDVAKTVSQSQSIIRHEDASNLNKFKDYKPSIISSVTYGPVQEQFLKGKHDKVIQGNKFNQDLQELIDILNLSNPKSIEYHKQLLNLNNQKFTNAIKTLSEDKLAEVLNFLLLQPQKNFEKLSIVMMNPKLNFKKIPEIEEFDLDEINEVKFKILMLRKYNLSHQPLKIMKSLKHNFHTIYPLIKDKSIPQYYERIFWYFYFRYNKDLKEKILELDDVYHSFTIWEALPNFQEVSKTILHSQKLSKFHEVFFLVVSNKSVGEIIKQNPNILNSMKKFSINHKIYANDLGSVNFAKLVNDQITPLLENPKSVQDLIEQLTEEDFKWNDKFMFLMNEIK